MWRVPISTVLSLYLGLGVVIAAEIVYVTELEIYSSLVRLPDPSPLDASWEA